MTHVKRHVIFDLDGTLINSSESVLGSFASAFENCNRELKYPLTEEIIGPPLMETLSNLSGTKDPSVLELLAQQFKKNYDEKKFQWQRNSYVTWR